MEQGGVVLVGSSETQVDRASSKASADRPRWWIIAGLAMGGCDHGDDSGDMMHWDMCSTQMGASVQKLARKYNKSSSLDERIKKGK